MAFDSPDYFNRFALYEERTGRKRVFYEASFESTQLLVYTGIGGTVERSFETAHSGEASLKLHPANAAGAEAKAAILLGIPYSKNIIYDQYFARGTGVGNSLMEFHLYEERVGKRWEAKVRYNDNTKKWLYQDSAGAWQNVDMTTQTFVKGKAYWNHFSFVVDFKKHEYQLLFCNDLLVNLSGLAMRYDGGYAGTYEVIRIYMYIANINGNVDCDLYIDDLILAEAKLLGG